MRFEHLLSQVQKSEQRVESRRMLATGNWQALKATWRESWTPGRILTVGLVGGFLFARTRPLRAVAGVSTARWIQLATSVSGLMASLKAAHSAESAEVAATDAETAATDAAVTAEVAAGEANPGTVAASAAAAARPTASERRRRADPQWDSEPRPAEAATELSER